MSDETRARQAVQRQLHAIEVYLLTTPPPDPTSESDMRRWAIGLARDTTLASNAVVWQAALDSAGDNIVRFAQTLGLTEEQATGVSVWLKKADVTEL